jgi:hypothetical protein
MGCRVVHYEACRAVHTVRTEQGSDHREGTVGTVGTRTVGNVPGIEGVRESCVLHCPLGVRCRRRPLAASQAASEAPCAWVPQVSLPRCPRATSLGATGRSDATCGRGRGRVSDRSLRLHTDTDNAGMGRVNIPGPVLCMGILTLGNISVHQRYHLKV